MEQTSRRGEITSLIGLILQFLFAAGLFVLGYVWNGSLATKAAGWFAAGGVLIWVAVWLVFRQEEAVDRESLEVDRLKKRRESLGQDITGLFGVEAEHQPGARRLQWMRRWMLPIFTLLVAVYEILVAMLVCLPAIRWPVKSEDWPAIIDPDLTLWFVGGIAFLSFLFSRYASGMARRAEWRLLRAGASFMFAVALTCLTLVVTLAVWHLFEAYRPERYLAYAIPAVMIALGCELALNFMMDIYRPRGAGMEDRPAFDSRLFGLVSEPGGIAHTLAEAVNYQFGFEVSKTWFYQLLERAFVPLLAFGALTMGLLTCLVIVNPGQQAVLERFGQPLGGRKAVLGPGLHFKLPSPIDRAYRYETEMVRELRLGFEDQEYTDISAEDLARQLKLVLWTTERHGAAPERMMVTVSRQVAADGQTIASVPSLIKMDVPVQYRISDVYDYHYQKANPGEMLKAIADGVLTTYVAGTEMSDLLAGDRAEAAQRLSEDIQRRADAHRLGVTITFVGLQNLHPPPEEQVAEAFQEVIGAMAEKEASIRSAEAWANKTLAEVVGTKKLALDLFYALRELERRRDEQATPEVIRRAEETVQRLFNGDDAMNGNALSSGVAGESAKMVYDARAYRAERENVAWGKAQRFGQELTGFKLAPGFYKLRKYLQVMAEGMIGSRKYVVAADTKANPLIIEFDVKNAPRPDLEAFVPGNQ